MEFAIKLKTDNQLIWDVLHGIGLMIYVYHAQKDGITIMESVFQ